jgi:hypothetical protein
MSISSVQSNSTFSGWTIATDAQVNNLFNNAGFSFITSVSTNHSSTSAANVAAGVTFAQTLGVTSSGNDYYNANGLTLTGAVVYNSGVQAGTAPSYSTPFAYAISNGLVFTTTSTNPGIGVWLELTVSPVPVPATIWLFSSAFVGFVGFSRRKQM